MSKIKDQDEIWVCQDGRQMKVGEMTEAHVRSALRLVLRNARRSRQRRKLALGLFTDPEVDPLTSRQIAELYRDKETSDVQ